MQTRQRLSVEIRKARLIAVGKRLFSQAAFDEISTDELAEAAGISKGLLYHYFTNKRGFYLATIESAAKELLDATRPSSGDSLGEVVYRSLQSFLSFVEEKPALYRALMTGGMGTDAEAQAVVKGVRGVFADRILALLDAEQPRAELSVQLYGWIGFVEQSSLRWLDHKEMDQPTLIRLQLRMLTSLFGAAAWAGDRKAGHRG